MEGGVKTFLECSTASLKLSSCVPIPLRIARLYECTATMTDNTSVEFLAGEAC